MYVYKYVKPDLDLVAAVLVTSLVNSQPYMPQPETAGLKRNSKMSAGPD